MWHASHFEISKRKMLLLTSCSFIACVRLAASSQIFYYRNKITFIEYLCYNIHVDGSSNHVPLEIFDEKAHTEISNHVCRYLGKSVHSLCLELYSCFSQMYSVILILSESFFSCNLCKSSRANYPLFFGKSMIFWETQSSLNADVYDCYPNTSPHVFLIILTLFVH